jgi:two-component system invasion response regulator UvrY
MMIKILVADDHAVVRNGLKQIVSDTPDITVAAEASNGRETLNKALEDDYDIVLLDITMPDRSGLDILKEIKSQKPELPVLILSMHPEEQYAVRALKAGAAGYLTKESAPEELIRAMRKVAGGGKYVTASLAEKLASLIKTNAEEPLHHALSDREYQVLCMIASGKRVKQIADELMLGVKTISTYRTRVLRKMTMNNDIELTRYAIQNQLVP